MAVVTTSHIDASSVDVLDFLFNQDDGILTQDGGFNPDPDTLQLPDLGLVRYCYKQLLLNLMPTAFYLLCHSSFFYVMYS